MIYPIVAFPVLIHHTMPNPTKISLYLIFALVAGLAMTACQAINQMQNFAKCSFRRQDMGKFNVAGIDVSGRRSLSDFGFADIATLGQAWGKPEFPLKYVVNVEVKNPNTQLASLVRLDWIAEVDGKDLVSGNVNDRVEVAPNGGTAIMPVNVSLDLKKLFASQERTAALSFLLDASSKGNDNDRIALKIKPYIRIAGLDIPYPGYLAIKKEFNSTN
jgi:hypothetical protein